MQKAIIVLLDRKENIYDLKYMIDELSNLALSDDILVSDVITQKVLKETANLYIGSGKVLDIKDSIERVKPDMVIFDGELSPTQLRNLEEELDITVIDRTLLILDIFAKRAKTSEAILEIKLAQNRYMLPRLHTLNKNLSRQGGSGNGFSSKGPGEKQIDLDKNKLLNEIYRMERELAKIHKMKVTQIEKRKENEVPIVALVGYTNAGKSTTMNKIIELTDKDLDKQVYVKDELFATLNTSTREITYNKHKFLLVDTIGFVSDLPHQLINSFRSTLEEIKHADLIIHVLDISSRYYVEQYNVTNQLLHELNCDHIKTLVLLNKYDLYSDNNTEIVGVENMPYSNKSNLNNLELIKYIYDNTLPSIIDMKVMIPFSEGSISHFIEVNAKIISKLYLNEGISYHIEINKKYYKKLAIYEIDNIIN